MASRVCPKCGALVRAERSAIRLTLRCINGACDYKVVKRMIEKGFG